MATGLLGFGHDITEMIMGFLGTQAYLSVASVSIQWRNAWGQQPTVTSRRWAVQSCSCLYWARACGLEIWDSPCLLAAADGRLDVLQHAVALGYSREGMPICEWAAGGGHLKVVKWGRTNGYPWGWSSIRAAEGGHLEVLKWCVANGCPTSRRKLPLQIVPRGHYRGKQPYQQEIIFEAFQGAVWGGHLETVMWCRDEGYWMAGSKFTDTAIERGHMDVLRYLVAEGFPLGKLTMPKAARAGDVEILEWCRANGSPWADRTVVVAAEGGHLEVVKWCVANDSDGREYIISRALAGAAGRGHLEVVKWMRASGCPWSDGVCYKAACGDHLEVLKWCLENGCPWGFPISAAKHEFTGSVSTMTWAASNGCPWISTKHVNIICRDAARVGNLKVLKWCTTYQPLPISEVSRVAASRGQVHILEWLRVTRRLSHGCVDVKLCMMAIQSGSLEAVKWCRTNTFPWGSATCYTAMSSGNLELLQWCRAHGCPWGVGTFEKAIVQGNMEAMAWCHENGCPLNARFVWKHVLTAYNDDVGEWCRNHLSW